MGTDKGTTAADDVRALLDGLDRAADDRVAIVAILWTWLEHHLLHLGSLLEKPLVIRAKALDEPDFVRFDEDERARLMAAPLRNAAELLARIEITLTRDQPIESATEAVGVDGSEVFVMWRRPRLATRAGNDADRPPEADEHPSLSALAPRLVVCPTVHRDIELHVIRPGSDGWVAVEALLEQGVVGADPTLSVHLDTLGDAGLSGWLEREDVEVGWFDAAAMDPEDERICHDSAVAAVEAASGPASLLVLPELCATPRTLDAVTAAIVAADEAPALTFVGLRHRPIAASEPSAIEPELLGDAVLATHVNEAVVIGPDGEPLWSHVKLSCAQGPQPRLLSDGTQPLAATEDIVLGRTLQVVPSPIGTIAVVICLDSFADHVRDRLARSGADVLIVPSLSPRVHRHRDSLQHLVQRLWAIAFVCNRDFAVPSDGTTTWDEEHNRSFWAIQRKRLRPPTRADDRPAFIFRLADHVRSQTSNAQV
ncbi:nitrilase-related carbon-nitrogen hydrolase [Conexibacter stalactiti]|uniref:Nitrilase-related carbon-nitrogen hydrolase n=1 Tax=Conexibacter stalactiti TaxID=1940611 RepID=A0ABU4HR72_9ACTN|nr:nitrilase-related carbon-nitrogen hydrolase [Conexibacter stalactiti]MDW5595782.1 nitrilase-related carbon-nitrogen hydrolase [Conexibacter stalactiti]MEC5036424.1 nitrilase-related carbon-nitrogen hydrolase [Conexibacter stalactiti]